MRATKLKKLRGPAALAILLLCIALAHPASASCGHERVSIAGTQSEIDAACEALADVRAYFHDLGFKVEPNVRIAFSDEVFIAVYDPWGAVEPARLQVSAFYDATNRAISTTTPTSTKRGDRKPWGIGWGSDIALSILRHELAHMFSHEILGARYARMSKPWLEFIAAAVQFDLMPPELRSRISQGFPSAEPFAFPEQVNAMIYGFDPDEFALRAYLHTRANGGRSFIRRLLAGDAGIDTSEPLWSK